MAWRVEFRPAFKAEFDELGEAVQDEMLAVLELLRVAGPRLKRPWSDTLNGSKYANMKELRFEADHGVWRVAYAFDPERKAVVLVAGDKSGVAEKRFYKALIRRADARLDEHLAAMSRNRRPK